MRTTTTDASSCWEEWRTRHEHRGGLERASGAGETSRESWASRAERVGDHRGRLLSGLSRWGRSVAVVLSLVGAVASILANPVSAQRFVEAGRDFFPSPVSAFSVATLDVDSDGRLDLFVGEKPPTLYLQQAVGRFSRTRLGRAEFDEEILEVFTVRRGPTPRWSDLGAITRNGIGFAHFDWATGGWFDFALLPGLTDVVGVLVGDLEGTGTELILVFQRNGPVVALRPSYDPRNFRMTRWEDVTAAIFPAGTPSWAAQGTTADFDSDGDLDLVLIDGRAVPASLRMFRNDGNGGMTEVPGSGYASLTIHGRSSAVAEDVDGDGDPDLVFSSGPFVPSNIVELIVLLNDGVGTFQLGPNLSGFLSASIFIDFQVLDVDADGDADVLAHELGKLTLLENDGAGGFQAVPDVWSGDPYTLWFLVAAADVSGDGLPDLLFDHPHYVVGGNRGNARFDLWSYPASPFGNQMVSIGDLDGDGTPDVFASNLSRINDGTGSRFSYRLNPNIRYSPGATALVDIDNDGDLDALISDDRSNVLWAYENDGSGGFTALTGIGSSGSQALALGDMDGDGLIDVLEGSHKLLRRLGLPGFVSGGFLPSHPRGTAWIRDFQGDGAPDIIDSEGSLYLQDSGTTNLAPSWFPVDPQWIRLKELVPADADGDGDLDLFAAAQPPQLWLNDGTGRFVDGTPGRLPSWLSSAERALWIEADEWAGPDLLVQVQGELVLLLNDGAGYFHLETFCATADLPIGSQRITAVDLDADGDQDVVFEGDGRIFLNRTRQLRAPVVPRQGRAWELEYHATPMPGTTRLVVTGVSLGGVQPRLPVGPLGTFGLDASTVSLLSDVMLPGSGFARRSFQIPSDSSLVGTTFAVQALFGSPDIRFSNVLVETVLH